MAGARVRKSLSRTMISGARLMPQPRVTRRAGNGWQDIPATRKTNARTLLLARRSQIYGKHDAHTSAAVAQSGWREAAEWGRCRAERSEVRRRGYGVVTFAAPTASRYAREAPPRFALLRGRGKEKMRTIPL